MTCASCGMPEGQCYNLCPNSPAFYSPEQERADDAFYGQDRWFVEDQHCDWVGDPFPTREGAQDEANHLNRMQDEALADPS